MEYIIHFYTTISCIAILIIFKIRAPVMLLQHCLLVCRWRRLHCHAITGTCFIFGYCSSKQKSSLFTYPDLGSLVNCLTDF